MRHSDLNDRDRLIPVLTAAAQSAAPGTEPKLVNCVYLPTCGGKYTYKVATPQNLARYLAERMGT